VTPTSPPPAPAAPADKIFGTRGVIELGGSFDFSVQRDIDPESISKATWFEMGLDAYAGYFVTKYFTLGLYLSVYFSQVKIADATSWRVTPGFLAAPGVAVRLVPRVFFYGDFLAGLFGQKSELNDLTNSRNTDVYGAVGAEVGLKLRLARRFLMRLGVRPIFFVGKSDVTTPSSDSSSRIRWFTFMLRIGFSGFM